MPPLRLWTLPSYDDGHRSSFFRTLRSQETPWDWLQGSGSAGSSDELLGAFVDAWERVNDRISLLRGVEYQLGHAVAIPEPGRDLSNAVLAVSFVKERWSQLERHVHELFFGDPRAEVAVLGGIAEETYRIEEGYLRTELTTRVIHPKPSTQEEWTAILKAVATGDQ